MTQKKSNNARRVIVSVIVSVIVTFIASMPAGAQCAYKNTAFKSGEFLSYNTYFNWKFVWVKVGTASMSVVQTKQGGKDAFRANLITSGNKRADELFVLRDTITCYCSTALEPLSYHKGAKEGSRYYVDDVSYSYVGGKTTIKQHRMNSKGEHTNKTETFNSCIYDMLNIFLRARSLDPSDWKKGHTEDFTIADGRKTTSAKLKYLGTTNVKADNGVKYRCLQLSYMELEKGKYKELVRFFVTDDANHLPIRLDMNLNFGSAKAFLTGMKGLKNPEGAIVK